MKELTRSQILTGKYYFPREMVNLIHTNHLEERMKERGIGLNILPTKVRVSEDNIHSAKTDDGVNLNSVVVRLKYSSTKFLFLCFNPIDGAVKTVWFRDKKRRKGE
jgi:hypothetical protein